MKCAITRVSVMAVLVAAILSPTWAVAAEWDHLHLNVEDTKAAAEWYAKHFDGTVTTAGPFDAVLFGNMLVKMRKPRGEFSSNVGSAVDHIAFSVPDVQAKIAELREVDIQVRPGGRRVRATGVLSDPWGTKIEILNDDDLIGFHHVHLKSQTSTLTARWYAEAFGADVGRYKNVPQIRAIRFGDMYLFVQRSVRAVAPTTDRSIDHIGWKTRNFKGLVENLKAMDTKFLVGPQKSGDHMMAFIEGPDGVKIEIVEIVSE